MPLLVLQVVSFWNSELALIGGIVLGLILGLNVLDIMTKLKQDEREVLHEALAERNATWAMATVLAIGLAYQVSVGLAGSQKALSFDPVIVIALIAGVIAKAFTNWKLEKSN